MRNIFISAGHGGLDSGASGNGYLEKDLTLELRNLIVTELAKIGIKAGTDPDGNALVKTLAFIKGKFGAKDILLDIHWNAGGGTGVEVIIPDVNSSFERQLAQRIADVVSSSTGFKKRGGGVKTEKDAALKTLGWMRPSSENILLETCFIDSKSDMSVYQVNKFRIAKDIANVLADFAQL